MLYRQQAKEAYKYKNIREKLNRCNAAIWYNKTCKQLTHSYITVKINGNNVQCRKTIKSASQYCLNQELKFLYIKKQNLNEQLYQTHLKCASYWKNNWYVIQASIDNKLQRYMETCYTHLNKNATIYKLNIGTQPSESQR
jgi:hypothetical protein